MAVDGITSLDNFCISTILGTVAGLVGPIVVKVPSPCEVLSAAVNTVLGSSNAPELRIGWGAGTVGVVSDMLQGAWVGWERRAGAVVWRWIPAVDIISSVCDLCAAGGRTLTRASYWVVVKAEGLTFT